MSLRTADVVIVGGGCMGASLAYHLARHRVGRIVLLEREPFLGTGSTGRNAGGVRHQFSQEANIRLSLESIALFERFAAETGSEIDFHQDGYLFLLSSEQSLAAFTESVARQRRFGIEVEWLDPSAAARLAPGLDVSGVRAATYCARDGIADPNGVTTGFARAAQAAGVVVQRGTEVTGIRVEGERVAAVETSRGAIETRVVVNAAGPWAAQVGAMAGVDLPVSPLRRHIFIAQPAGGEWIETRADGSRAPSAPERRLMVIDFDTTFYFHREGSGVLFGMADPEERRGYDTTVRWDFLPSLVEVAVTRLPALADASISHAWAGLYEMTPDAMPIIGPVAARPGLYVIAGFSGHGFQHSPAAGRILADLITGTDPAFDVSPFAFERFDRPSAPGEAHVV